MNKDLANQDEYLKKINILKSLKKTTSQFLKWNQNNQKWQYFSKINTPKPYSSPTNTIKLLSFNVLFDKLHLLGKKGSMEHVLNSQQRYAYIIKQICTIQPDIIALQEVTICFYDMLLEFPQIKKRYWVSDFRNLKQSWGNILLTRIQPICIESIKVKRLPRIVQTGFFSVLNNQTKQINIVALSSVHLIALDKNFNIRTEQLGNLIKQLKYYQQVVSDYILQGDMNFHAQSQTQIALKHNLRDSWLQKYKNLENQPGYTFDSSYNGLINQIYWGFQRRRMRLDRIFYLGNILQVNDINVIFNKPIHKQKQKVNNHIFLKGGILYVTDYFGVNLHKQKQQFLFPSDHFGLLAVLKIKQNNNKQFLLKE